MAEIPQKLLSRKSATHIWDEWQQISNTNPKLALPSHLRLKLPVGLTPMSHQLPQMRYRTDAKLSPLFNQIFQILHLKFPQVHIYPDGFVDTFSLCDIETTQVVRHIEEHVFGFGDALEILGCPGDFVRGIGGFHHADEDTLDSGGEAVGHYGIIF